MEMDETVDESTQELIKSMRETMHAAFGVGLAAPQVGYPLQLVVIEDQAEFIKKVPPEQVTQSHSSHYRVQGLLTRGFIAMRARPSRG